MERCYKTISVCSMCKKRFSVETKKGISSYVSGRYCPECSKKYFPKKEA